MLTRILKAGAVKVLIPVLDKLYPYKYHAINLSFSRFCNASCRMCVKTHYDERSSSLYLEEKTLESALAQLKSMHVRDVNVFAMGEPLAHPRFNEFIDKIVNAGLRVIFSSNAGLLKEKHFSALAKVHSLGFSIEGYDGETVRHYRGVSFDVLYKRLTGLRKIVGSKWMTLRTTIYKSMDEAYIEKLIDAWGPLFDEITWGIAHPPELYCEKPEGIQKSSSDEYFTFVRDKNSECTSGILGVVILPNGDVTSCVNDYATRYVFGNINETHFRDILQSGILAEFVRKAQTNVDHICGNCSAYFSIAKEDEKVFKERVKFANRYFAKLKHSN